MIVPGRLPSPPMRCPRCHALDFSAAEAEQAPGLRPLRCVACGEAFALCDGVPYLGGFDHHDATFLVESLAARRAADGSLQPLDPENASRARGHPFFDAIEAAWLGEATSESTEKALPTHLLVRSTELLFARTLMSGMDFTDRQLLDVGAGTGMDAFLFHRAGARVTALEPNLGLLAIGGSAYPEFTWLGGSADAVPLDDGCMDIVTANASLHHHVDVRTSFNEMIRVLKTGGWILTVGDSFKASSAEPVQVDWEQFDWHPDVLRGINEQILRLDMILDHLQGYGGVLEGHVYLREGHTGSWRVFTLEEAQAEARSRPRLWGVMAMRLRKVRDCTPAPARMRRGSLSSLELTIAIRHSLASGFAALARLLPATDLRDGLPLEEASRLMQLNGWRWPRPGAGSRFAFERGRLFLRRKPESRFVTLEFNVPPIGGATSAIVACGVDGAELRRTEVPRGVWHVWSLELPTTPVSGDCCCFELQLVSDAPPPSTVEPSRHIEVRRVELAATAAAESLRLADHTTLTALLKEHHAGPITLVTGARVETTLSVVRRLLAHGAEPLAVVASNEVWPFLSWHPKLARHAQTTRTGLTLHSEAPDASQPQAPSGNAWKVHADGAASRLNAPEWPDPQLTLPSPFDQERRQLTARLARSEARLQEAKARADKFKEKYEAARHRKPGWLSRTLGKLGRKMPAD